MAEMFSLSEPRATDALRLADRPGHLEDRPPLGSGPDRPLPRSRNGSSTPTRPCRLVETSRADGHRVAPALADRRRLVTHPPRRNPRQRSPGPAERNGPGRRWHCPAPDHDDHRASVTMYTDRHGHERWRCWSGDHRGDAIDLVLRRRRQPTRRRRLVGVARRHVPRPADATRRPEAAPGAMATTMDPAVERYARICAAVLAGPQGVTCGTGCMAAGSTTPPSAPICSAATRAAGCAVAADSPTARSPRRRSRRSTRPDRSASCRPATSTSTPPAAVRQPIIGARRTPASPSPSRPSRRAGRC